MGSFIPSKRAQYKSLSGQFSESRTTLPKCENVLQDVYVRLGPIHYSIKGMQNTGESFTALHDQNHGQSCPNVKMLLKDVLVWMESIIPSKDTEYSRIFHGFAWKETKTILPKMLKCSRKTSLCEWGPLFHQRMQNTARSFMA